jgi:hypothetical protein
MRSERRGLAARLAYRVSPVPRCPAASCRPGVHRSPCARRRSRRRPGGRVFAGVQRGELAWITYRRSRAKARRRLRISARIRHRQPYETGKDRRQPENRERHPAGPEPVGVAFSVLTFGSPFTESNRRPSPYHGQSSLLLACNIFRDIHPHQGILCLKGLGVARRGWPLSPLNVPTPG